MVNVDGMNVQYSKQDNINFFFAPIPEEKSIVNFDCNIRPDLNAFDLLVQPGSALSDTPQPAKPQSTVHPFIENMPQNKEMNTNTLSTKEQQEQLAEELSVFISALSTINHSEN